MKNKICSQSVKLVANSVLGIALVFIWSRFVNFGQILDILKTTDPKFVLSFISFFGLAGALRGIRFKILLHKYHRIPVKDMVMLTYLAQFLSFMIPLRIGELSKSVYLHSQYNLHLGKAVVWVFIDRFLDFLMIIATICILLQFIPTILPENFLPIILAVLVLFGVGFIAAVVSGRFLKKAMVFVSHILVFSSLKKGFISFTHTIIDGFDILRREPWELIGLLVFTLFILVVDGMIWWSAFSALGVNLGIFKSMLGNGLSALTFLIPSAPGYVGSAEAAGLAVFGGVLGFNANLASAATILMHIITMVCLLAFGLTSLYLLKFDLGAVWRKLRKGD